MSKRHRAPGDRAVGPEAAQGTGEGFAFATSNQAIQAALGAASARGAAEIGAIAASVARHAALALQLPAPAPVQTARFSAIIAASALGERRDALLERLGGEARLSAAVADAVRAATGADSDAARAALSAALTDAERALGEGPAADGTFHAGESRVAVAAAGAAGDRADALLREVAAATGHDGAATAAFARAVLLAVVFAEDEEEAALDADYAAEEQG